MSHTARIEIRLTPNAPSMVSIVEVLVESGWQLTSADLPTIGYYGLERGTGPTYAYTFAATSAWPQVRLVIQEKERRQELIGLRVHQADTEVNLTFDPTERELSAAINNAGRKLLNTCGRYTDLNWYVTALVCPLERQGMGIWAVRCFEY